MKNEKLLSILADDRIHSALEVALKNSEEYYLAQEAHDKACEKLKKADLNKRQYKLVDKVLSTANDCGAIYGAIAYRQGVEDGIRLVAELRKIIEC